MYNLKQFKTQEEHDNFINSGEVHKPYVHVVGNMSNVKYKPKNLTNYCKLGEQKPRDIELQFTYPTDVELIFSYHDNDVWAHPSTKTIPVGTQTFIVKGVFGPIPMVYNGEIIYIHTCSISPSSSNNYNYELSNSFNAIRIYGMGDIPYQGNLTWEQFVKSEYNTHGIYINEDGYVIGDMERICIESGEKIVYVKPSDMIIPLNFYRTV
jgi:hypothetical protein